MDYSRPIFERVLQEKNGQTAWKFYVKNPIANIFGLRKEPPTSKEPMPEKLSDTKRDVIDSVLFPVIGKVAERAGNLAVFAAVFVDIGLRYVLADAVGKIAKPVLAVIRGGGSMIASSQKSGSFYVGVSQAVNDAGQQLKVEWADAAENLSLNTTFLRTYVDSHQHSASNPFKRTQYLDIDEYTHNTVKMFQEYAARNQLTNKEVAFWYSALTRTEDARFFMALAHGQAVNMQDALLSTANHALKESSFLHKGVRSFFRDTDTKFMIKETVGTTLGIGGRDINDAKDLIGIIFQGKLKNFTFKNYMWARDLIHGSYVGSNNRGEVATGVMAGNVVVKGTGNYDQPSLWHLWAGPVSDITIRNVLRRLEEHVEFYDSCSVKVGVGDHEKIAKLEEGGYRLVHTQKDQTGNDIGYTYNNIHQSKVKTDVPAQKIGTKIIREPVKVRFGIFSVYAPGKKKVVDLYDNFTYGELYKDGFTRERALKAIQALYMQPGMEQAARGREYVGGNDDIVFNKIMMPLLNCVEELNEQNRSLSGKRTNFTGLRIFDSDIPHGDIPKTQLVKDPHEQFCYLAMIYEKMFGTKPRGHDDFVDSHIHLITTDPAKSDADDKWLGQKIATEIMYARAAGLEKTKGLTPPNANGLTGLALAKYEGEKLLNSFYYKKEAERPKQFDVNTGLEILDKTPEELLIEKYNVAANIRKAAEKIKSAGRKIGGIFRRSGAAAVFVAAGAAANEAKAGVNTSANAVSPEPNRVEIKLSSERLEKVQTGHEKDVPYVMLSSLTGIDSASAKPEIEVVK